MSSRTDSGCGVAVTFSTSSLALMSISSESTVRWATCLPAAKDAYEVTRSVENRFP